MTAAVLAVNGAGLTLLLCLWWWTKVVDAQPKTVAEAAVRSLQYLVRWLRALAEALDSGIIAYREVQHREICRPRAEVERTLRAAAAKRAKAQREEPDSEESEVRALSRWMGDERGSIDSMAYLYVLVIIASVYGCTVIGLEVREAWQTVSNGFERLVR
jgi:hypothetical protein